MKALYGNGDNIMVPSTEVFVNFPSGRIVISDDLRPVFDVDFGKWGEYNTLAGQSKVVQRMADIGCAFSPASDSSFPVFKTPEGSLVIADIKNYYSGEPETHADSSLPAGWVEVAFVNGDVYACAVADYDNWVSKGGEKVEEGFNNGDKFLNGTIVSVTPGRYKFTSYATATDFDENADVAIYASLELV